MRKGKPPPPCARQYPQTSRPSEQGLLGRGGLITPDDHVDIERVEFDAAADATGLVGGDEGRARAQKWVQHDVAAVGEIEKSILEHN
jgi:hypothetical protein